jgi:phage terminase small subunit
MKSLGGEVMGRNAQPIAILKANGRKHLTKAEIDNRQQSEIRLGDNKLKCPDFVKDDVEAYKKWKEVTKLYKDVDFVSSGDIGLLARYCKTFSEYLVLQKSYQRINEIHYDCKELDEAIDGTYADEDSDKEKALFSYKVKKQLRDLFSIGAILSIETAINKKMDMLIKMEDRLFLNPLAKVKNVPKQEPKKQEDPNGGMFGD